MGDTFYELVATYRVQRDPTVIVYCDRDLAVADARKMKASGLTLGIYESVRLYEKREVDFSDKGEVR